MDFKQNPHLDVFKSELVKGASFGSVYEMPLLARSDAVAQKAIPFGEALRATDCCQWIHFYTHDMKFERVWKEPKRYLPLFQRFDGVITPDYSLYRELPLAMQIWNTYRNRAIAFWLQANGIPIIPNVRWGDERTYGFAFEGIPQGSTVAVSTNGCIRNNLDRYYFRKGLRQMVDTLKPKAIVNYSQTPDDVFGEFEEGGLPILRIENYHDTVRAAQSAKAVK